MKPILVKGRCLLLAITILPFLHSQAEPPVFQWGNWVAPKSANALKNPLKGDKAATANGEQLFNAICFVCHGNHGKGDGINAAALERRPADLTSRRVQRQTDGALFWKITEGNPPMLRFAETLSEEQRWQMVNFVRRLAVLYPSEETVAEGKKAAPASDATNPAAAQKTGSKEAAPEIEAAPVAAAANPFAGISDGKQLFKSICSACHSIGQGKMVGPDLRGVNSRHDNAWLHRWIHSSQDLVKSGDASAVRLFEENNRVVMTDHRYLTDGQIDGILGYIEEEGKSISARQQTAAVTSQLHQAVAQKIRPPSVYSEMVTYFLYAGFAFVVVALLMVVSILNKMVR